MTRLLAGPPGSGAQAAIHSEILARLAQGDSLFRVLVPTAAMARQVRQSLAGAGRALGAGAVATIAEFVESLKPGASQPSPAAHEYLFRQALGRLDLAEFRALAASPGLIATLARAQEELFNAGCDALRLEALAGMGVLRGRIWKAFCAAAAEVEQQMRERGFAFRASRIAAAASALRHSPPAGGGAYYWDGFFSLTLAERELVKALAARFDVTVSMPEWPGAAATLASLSASGFRVVRHSEAGPAPAEELVAGASIDDEVEEIALRIRESHARGRAWSEMLIVLRSAMPYLPLLRTVLARFGIPARLYFTSPLSQWGDSLGPALAAPLPAESEVLAWQRRAAIESASQSALEDARAWMDPAPESLAELAVRAPEFLRNTPVRLRDGRQDVVSVVDVFEARQWRVPEAFVCGLEEGQFPRRPAPEALLTAAVRRRLAAQGIPIDTDLDRARQEDFLFEFARTRATDRLTLSWRRYDASGEAVERSRWLDHLTSRVVEARAVRLKPLAVREPARPPALLADEPRRALRKIHARLRATALESFLQCPFQFYGRSTIALEASAAEEDPLEARELGTVIHKVVAAWYKRRNVFIEFLFEDEWAGFVTANGIPQGYRAEVARSALLRSLSNLAASPRIEPGWAIEVEQPVAIEMEGVRVHGRIDRFDIGPEKRVRAYDFKYSGKASVDKRFRKTEEGQSVQGGLYLLGLREKGFRPEAFEFAALRGEITWKGWSGPEIAPLMAQAEERSRSAISRILAGEIHPDPADKDLCRYCEFRDACRSAGRALKAEGGAAFSMQR